MRMRLLTVAIVLLSGLIAACGGGADSGDSQNGTDDEAELLERMVLTAGDLSPGLEQASTSLTTNEDLAQAAVNPDGERGRLKQFGRILGYEVQFAPGQDAGPELNVRGAQNSVSLFEAASGASRSLAEGLAAARSSDWEAMNSDLKNVNVDPLPVPDGADEGGWFRITGNDGGGNLIIDDQVAFRVENVRAYLRVVFLLPPGTSADANKDQVQGWTVLSAQRIRDVLNRVPG